MYKIYERLNSIKLIKIKKIKKYTNHLLIPQVSYTQNIFI